MTISDKLIKIGEKVLSKMEFMWGELEKSKEAYEKDPNYRISLRDWGLLIKYNLLSLFMTIISVLKSIWIFKQRIHIFLLCGKWEK